MLNARAIGIGATFCLLVFSNSHAEQPNDRHAIGRELFERQWKHIGESELQQRINDTKHRTRRRFATVESLADGLGPLHNATSCAECHSQGGASGVKHNVILITVDPQSDIVLNAKDYDGSDFLELFPGLLATNGVLLFETLVHARSTNPDYTSLREGLAKFVSGGIDDKWFVAELGTSQAIASTPVISGSHGPVTFRLSQRNTPALHGLGLIDRISSKRLEAVALRQAQASGGQVTGRLVGRFGWRGQVPSLANFVRQACVGELGLSVESMRFNAAQDDVDMTSRDLQALTNYVSHLPKPADYSLRDRDSLEGERVFDSIGCATCHQSDIHPARGIFSDLLLHDMGPDLMASMPAPLSSSGPVLTHELPRISYDVKGTAEPGELGAYGSGGSLRFPSPQPFFGPHANSTSATWTTLQQEWRTPPLWGVADSAPYLHDGRAATMEEAIQWHGGEADASRQAYQSLDTSDKTKLLIFLSNLQAPESTARKESDGA